uniref:Uncharacterized protein n=1 Tax=Cyprinus carpio carpio TaxID=630221 RepID=A0A9J8BKI4_CYPCA
MLFCCPDLTKHLLVLMNISIYHHTVKSFFSTYHQYSKGKNKSSSTKSRPFSPSSELYFVNQIQNSMSGSMYDFPSNPNGSVAEEPEQHLESVAETEVITSRDGEKEDDTHMPSDDDIEKAFRVNQDGSMTVEMKVRLTIKEEETIHWTTTVSRSSVYNQFKAATISCPDLDANLPDNLPPQSDTLTIEVSESDLNDSNHFCPEDGCKVNEETEMSGGAASMELERLPSPLSHFPGLHKVHNKQESIESIKTVSDTEFHKNHSYSDMEELDNEDVKQEYCMVQHCNHPVPKPRCTLASEIHTTTQLQLSDYRCSENLQFQDNQEKMYETPLHIYEKQTCQENFSDKTQHHLQFLGSSPHEYVASSDTTFPASSDEIFHSFNEEIKSENLATIKCQSIGKQCILSQISKPCTSTDKTNTTSTKRAKVTVTPVTASSKASVSKRVLTLGTTTKRKAVRVVVKKNHLFKSAIPKRKQRANKTGILKEINKNSTTKGAQKRLKMRNNNGNVPVKPQTEQLECVQLKTDDLSSFLVEKDQNNIQVQAGSYTLPKTKMQKASLNKGMLRRQTSEYVELWLQRCTKVKPPLLIQPSLETIPKNNTMVKASLFCYESCNAIQPSTNEAFEEKEICLYSPKTKKPEQLNSDHLTKTRENQQTSEFISKTDSYNTENTLRRPLGIQTEPSKELIDMQAHKFYTVKMAVRPDMKPVLDQVCNYIESLREITQHKWSCSKMSKCVPDFSSHVESVFSASPRVILAFLCVMTLKDGLSHLNACGQADANLSCSEAMHMLQSLKELAAIKDAEHLRISLSHLHNSASVQLLQSWKGFQVLINKARCSSATPETTVSESNQSSSSEEEEHAIQMLMEHLGVPERVREELAALNYLDESIICNQIEDTDKVSDSFPAMKINGFSELHSKEEMDSTSDCVLEDYVNMYVHSVIDRAITAHLKDNDNSQVSVVGSLERPEKDLVIEDRYQQDLRNANFYNTKKKIQGDAIPVSDICKDMPPGESSFEAEMYRELEKVGHKRQEEETFEKHQENVKGMSRVERQKEITEGRGTCKENSSKWDNSESLKTVLKNEELLRKVVNEVEKDRDTVVEEGSKLSESLVSCIGKFSAKEKVNQQDENGRYSDETFPKDKYFSKENRFNVKSPDPNDGAEQICSKETIPGHWQNEFQAIQTPDQLHRDIVLPEVQSIPHTHIESNIEMDEIQHSITHQDCCMESWTYSEKEHVILDAPECYTIYQENCVEIPEEIIECEENENNFKEARASTVAKPISSLQDQEKSVAKGPYDTEQTTGKRLLNHISITNREASKVIKTTESGSMDSVSSSLAFSYDSKNSDLSKDSEAHIQTNRVKSIRDMFLAKSNTDMRHGQERLSSPSSELSNYQLESSHRKEYQLLTSSEVSREEKNTCRLSIAKGYVKRTIEQLYGKGSKGCNSDEKRSPSADKVEKREGLRGTNASSLPSLHEIHTNPIPYLSYFNATSSVDSLNEPMNCVTLNARVGPKDEVLIDKGRWLLRENQMSLKSCSENEDTSKNIEDKDVLAESKQDSGKEDIPYSLFGHSSLMPDKDPSSTEQEEECPGRTITYFHLPDANDFEIQPDHQKTNTQKRKRENKVTPLTEPPNCWSEEHSIVTVATPKAANKVHPVIETIPPVITQPTKGQSAEVARHSVEPDALEILYMFCGQHCPIL